MSGWTLNVAVPTLGDGTAVRLNLMKEDSQSLRRDHVENGSWAFAPSIALGLNTPPVGVTQFVGCAIGGVSVGQGMKSILPFYSALTVCLMLVTYVPAISLWLPNLLLGR